LLPFLPAHVDATDLLKQSFTGSEYKDSTLYVPRPTDSSSPSHITIKLQGNDLFGDFLFHMRRVQPSLTATVLSKCTSKDTRLISWVKKATTVLKLGLRVHSTDDVCRAGDVFVQTILSDTSTITTESRLLAWGALLHHVHINMPHPTINELIAVCGSL